MFRFQKFRYVYRKSVTVNVRRCISSVETSEIIYTQNGDPNKVLELTSRTLDPQSMGNKDVLIKMLAAPINPADINMIQGVYPIRPTVPAIGGSEGVGEVIIAGKDVKNLQEGDWVVPGFSGWGSWRTYAISSENDLMKIPNDIPAPYAATMTVNPCTAYRMLKDFADLRPGDVIIQNGANSGVGQCVIQIAKSLGVRTVNIVRDRPNIEELTELLKAYGADYVLTDEFVRKPDMKELMKSLPKPRLALNCVGGRASAELLKYLERRGQMITYGGMSKQPMMVPAGPLIFTDVILRGYWMTQWNQEHRTSKEHVEMWSVLCDMVRCGELKLPLSEIVKISDFKHAISRSMEPFLNRKQILTMT